MIKERNLSSIVHLSHDTNRQGLEPSLRLRFAAYDDQMELENFIHLSIWVGH